MLEDLKRQVVEIAKEADASGLCKHGSGNFSIKDKKTGLIAVTPSHVSRKVLTYKDICIVDMDANVVESETHKKPTSELLMHIEAYKIRKDINAVVHTHSHFATSFAVLGKEIPPIVYEAMHYGGTACVAPYGRPGTMELAKSIIKPIRSSDACLLEKHGVLTVGSDLSSALLKAFYVEEVAELYYTSLLINGGKEPIPLSLEEIKKWKYPSEIKLRK